MPLTIYSKKWQLAILANLNTAVLNHYYLLTIIIIIKCVFLKRRLGHGSMPIVCKSLFRWFWFTKLHSSKKMSLKVQLRAIKPHPYKKTQQSKTLFRIVKVCPIRCINLQQHNPSHKCIFVSIEVKSIMPSHFIFLIMKWQNVFVWRMNQQSCSTALVINMSHVKYKNMHHNLNIIDLFISE